MLWYICMTLQEKMFTVVRFESECKKGTKRKQEVKAAETRETLQREKCLQKRKQKICRSLLSLPAQQYFCVDKIQDF